ncbi:hypothetical protein [Embleya scabrispora]|uniref:hypothetical protein n=1 Tax=Embleya scabrispora TaxID=159449 RepID=UPI001914D6F5|nr:hypothetical protein [Embleya scabrispora]
MSTSNFGVVLVEVVVLAGVLADVPVLGLVITVPVCEGSEEEADMAARTWSA